MVFRRQRHLQRLASVRVSVFLATVAAAVAPVVLQLRWVGVFKPILHHRIHREYGLELLWSAGVFGIGIVMLLSKDDRICVINSVVPI
jgi:hypothetical protein